MKARAEKPSQQQKRRATTDGVCIRRGPRHRHNLVSYVLEIERWEWDYDFGVHWSVFHRIYEVTDYAHLNVYGTFISPSAVSGRRIDLTFIPDRRGSGRYGETPDWIGHLRRAGRGKDLEAIFPMPADMLAPVLASLRGDLFHYAKLEGELMFRNEAGIRHYGFRRALVDDELPTVPTPWPNGKPLPELRRRILGR